MQHFRIIFAVFAAAVLSTPALAQSEVGTAHLPIENPADLKPEDAEAIYRELADRMAEGYAVSRLDIIDDYRFWTRLNTAPYISATHGSRFVNNYVNAAGADYGTMKEGETLPAGTVLAKDAVTITDDGKKLPGAMFVMEKLATGTNPPTGDWRYVVVNPDGSFFGDTTGEEPQLVDYCHACHQQVANRDYTFGVPKEYRAEQ